MLFVIKQINVLIKMCVFEEGVSIELCYALLQNIDLIIVRNETCKVLMTMQKIHFSPDLKKYNPLSKMADH